MVAPHPDCKAEHVSEVKVDTSYIGPTHACAGPNCPGIEHRATGAGAAPGAAETGCGTVSCHGTGTCSGCSSCHGADIPADISDQQSR